VTQCGRICIGRRKINLSTVFSGQYVGGREVADQSGWSASLEALKRKRRALVDEIARLEQEHAAVRILVGITQEHVERLLREVADDLGQLDREPTKEMPSTPVDQIALDPRTLECRVHSCIGLSDRNGVASPRVTRLFLSLRLPPNSPGRTRGNKPSLERATSGRRLPCRVGGVRPRARAA
jgi:hypothetical protein